MKGFACGANYIKLKSQKIVFLKMMNKKIHTVV